MKLRKFILYALWWCGFAGSPPASQPVTVGFYNVENLYDTIPSPFYDDEAFTPSGRNGWNTRRYERKIRNLCRVIDDMGLDILGLAEVENEAVVRDLVTTLSTDYCYIHRTTNDSRGMDMALLYKGDKFYPRCVRQIPSGSRREFLHVKGELCGQSVDIIVCHLPSRLNRDDYRGTVLANLYRTVDSLVRNDPGACPIVMGDFNADPADRLMRRRFGTGRKFPDGTSMLFTPLLPALRQGHGSYMYRGRWYLYDNIFLAGRFACGPGLRVHSADVFVKSYMISGAENSAAPDAGSGGMPLRSFRAGRYEGGYSDHLPVFCVLKLW